MDAPTEEAVVFLPMERVIYGGRKAAKRTLLGDLYVDEIQLAAPFSPPPPQDEDIPARKKRRLDPSAAAATSGVIDLYSHSDDEKPKAKEDSSSTDAAVGTYAISSFLGKTFTPNFTTTAKAAAKTHLHLMLQWF
jgi:hypothetical protein